MPEFAVLNEAIVGHRDALLCAGPKTSDRLIVRFERESDEPDPGIRARIVTGDPAILDSLIRQHLPLEVSFNTDSARVFFDSVPARRGRRLLRRWVLLAWPERLSVVERRSGSREPVPEDVPVVSVLSGPAGGPTLRARLWDLSPTGAAFLCPAHLELEEPKIGQTYAVLLTYEGIEYRFNACCRHVQRLSSISLRAGMEFDAQKDFDPELLSRFNRFLKSLEALRIRQGFRSTLTKTVLFTTA